MELAGLFLSSFLAATLLPGGSEVALFALLKLHPEQTLPALILATIGNTLGGMTTYAMARLLPQKLVPQESAVVARHGAPALVLAWVPIIGDALCAAAGWLRLPWLACALWMALGKGLRYAFVAAGAGVL
ncbi:MAG TPA: YqaA family protein [Rhodocyclaceae bacterium]|nr:YqaA family protein [Rhodocyclaceae bacterium]